MHKTKSMICYYLLSIGFVFLLRSTRMDPHLLASLESTYADWEEEERRFAHSQHVHAILDSLEPDNIKERDYQWMRLRYSPAYFSGSMLYRGERCTDGPVSASSTATPPATATLYAHTTNTNTNDSGIDTGEIWGKWVVLWMILYGEQL